MANSPVMSFPPFRLYHAAYVATDMTKGTRRLSGTHGVKDFEFYENIRIEVPGGIADIDVALGQAGVMPIEVIVPRGGKDGVYRQALSSDPDAITFHHFCSLVESGEEWNQVLETIEKCRLEVLVRGSGYGTRGYVYIDTRPTLGHIVEFLYREDAAA